MKMKGLIVGALVAILCIGLVPDVSAHGPVYRRGYNRPHRPHRVWVAPPPPPIIVVAPHHRYHHRYRGHYAHPGHHYGHYKKGYSHKGHSRRW